PGEAGLGWDKRATRSGRGGTTGRCAGCPTSPGRVGGRSPDGWPVDGRCVRGGRGAAGKPGAPAAAGDPASLGASGAPGGGGVARPFCVTVGRGITGARAPSGNPPGKGCRGPDRSGACAAGLPAWLERTCPGVAAGGAAGDERICPGRGAVGKGLACTTAGRAARGAPGLAIGGRRGNAGRPGAAVTG